jgi:hypothetical protein
MLGNPRHESEDVSAMVRLRNLAHAAVDGVSDRFDHLITALEADVAAPIPESVRQLESDLTADSDSTARALGGLIAVEGFDDGGSTVRDFPHTGVPLLDTFYFRFTSADHHLAMITVDPDRPAGKVSLTYRDKNGDDDYYYKIAHRIVADARVQKFSRSTDICSESTCTVPLSKPAGDFVFVLIGFSFRFTGARDHHINQVRILEANGDLQVQFRDKNGSPPPIFLWDIQFAYVPRDLFVTLGTSSGNGDRGGAGRDIAAGPSVIRGFSFDFQSDDHHLKDIGVTTPDHGRVEVFYGDKNGDDKFNWVVRWGILTS